MIIFSVSTSSLLKKISPWFPWRLVSIGSVGRLWTPSDIKKSLTQVLKLLKKVAVISNGKTASDGSEEELDLKLIYQLIDHKPSVFIIINLILRKDLILQYCGICTSHSCTIYDIFTISNHTSFTYRRILDLKFLMQNYESTSPISFFRAPMLRFIPLSKSEKWTNRLRGALGIWLLILEYTPFSSNGSVTQSLLLINLYVHFESDLYRKNIIKKDK